MSETVTVIPSPHPAPYSASVIETMSGLIWKEAARLGLVPAKLRILDPMAGIGRVHQLPGRTVGIEIEPEWAFQHPDTHVGDATHLQFRASSFHIVATSPCYGNRMADHHEAKDGSRRRSYRHDLGRMPSLGSSGILHYGEEYRELHRQAWSEATRVLKPEGMFILNVSDFIRAGAVVRVAEWHVYELIRMGYRIQSCETVPTPRMRYGANHAARVDGELVVAMRAP